MRGRGGRDGRAPLAYRTALRLLPTRLRERYGRELEAGFVDALEGARGRGVGAVARVWIGGLADVVRRAAYERVRVRGAAGSGRPLADLGPDLRFGARAFARRPGITFLSVLMLALGVGASVAVFTVAEALFLRPLPVPAPERLVALNETAPSWNLETTGLNYAHFAAWREGARAFEAMGLFDVGSANVSLPGAGGEARAERVSGAYVTHDLDDALGLAPLHGRMIAAEEDAPGGDPVVVVGYGLWRGVLGGRADAVGTTLRVDGVDRTIIGVLPAEAGALFDADVWVPMGLDAATWGGGFSFNGVGRLRAGVTPEAALEDLNRVHQGIWDAEDPDRTVSPWLRPLRELLVADYRGMAVALAVAVGLVLLIACGNVASLLLARAHARRRELGVRVALGASASRVARQLFAESLALALVAGPLGLALGFGLVRALAARLPEDVPAWIVLEPSWRTALFALALILATALLFGLAPVLQARRQGVRDALVEGGRGGASRAQRRTMGGLVVAEVTLAALLLVGAGLLLRAFDRLQREDPGFRTEDVLTFRLALPESAYGDSAAVAGFYRDVREALAALPGVRDAALVTCPPLGCHWGNFFRAEGQAEPAPGEPNPVVLYRLATPEYADVMGIRLLHGDFLAERAVERTAVVNDLFATHFFGAEDVVGRRIRFSGGDPEDEESWIRIVGVVRDVRHYGLDEPMRPSVYLPYWPSPNPARGMAVVLRTDVEPRSLIPAARDRIRAIDPELPMYDIRTAGEALRRSLAMRRASSWSMAVFAGLALLLALGGIYGVLSYAVGQRGREIGIRVALGASRARVARLVLAQGMALAGAGLILGFAAALAAGRGLASLLVGLPAHDPVTFVVVAAVLGGTALAASLVPARRALRVEPQVALREE